MSKSNRWAHAAGLAAGSGRIAALEQVALERKLPFFKISSVTGEGIEALKRAMAEVVLAPPVEVPAS